MSLAERLKTFRKECGFSQQQIADKLNIHRTTYSYYESGSTEPSSDNLLRLSRIFNVTVNELLGVCDEFTANGVRQKMTPYDEEDGLLDRRVGTTRIGELTNEEKRLIISYRTLTKEQRDNLIETMMTMGLKSEKEGN